MTSSLESSLFRIPESSVEDLLFCLQKHYVERRFLIPREGTSVSRVERQTGPLGFVLPPPDDLWHCHTLAKKEKRNKAIQLR